jgi:chromosome segregation ATPase
MLKKFIVVAIVGGLALSAVGFNKWSSYVRNEVKSWREAAEATVPPEAEIARLRDEVKALDGDAVKIVKQLARLQSDQADLVNSQKNLETKKITAIARVTIQETAIREAEQKVKSGEANVSIVFGDQKYSIATSKERLKTTVAEVITYDKELTHVRQKMEVQTRIIDKMERQRLEMNRLKSDLDTAIDEIEVQVQALKLQQMESSYQTDDSRLSSIKESIGKMNKRIDIQRRELSMLQDTTPTATGTNESVDSIVSPLKKKGD